MQPRIIFSSDQEIFYYNVETIDVSHSSQTWSRLKWNRNKIFLSFFIVLYSVCGQIFLFLFLPSLSLSFSLLLFNRRCRRSRSRQQVRWHDLSNSLASSIEKRNKRESEETKHRKQTTETDWVFPCWRFSNSTRKVRENRSTIFFQHTFERQLPFFSIPLGEELRESID